MILSFEILSMHFGNKVSLVMTVKAINRGQKYIENLYYILLENSFLTFHLVLLGSRNILEYWPEVLLLKGITVATLYAITGKKIFHNLRAFARS